MKREGKGENRNKGKYSRKEMERRGKVVGE